MIEIEELAEKFDIKARAAGHKTTSWSASEKKREERERRGSRYH